MKLFLLLLLILGVSSCDNSRVPAADGSSRILEAQSYIGFDMNDNLKQCRDRFDTLNCPQEFTESDAFALNCEREGKYAIQCGCHDWICVEEMDLDLIHKKEDQLNSLAPQTYN